MLTLHNKPFLLVEATTANMVEEFASYGGVCIIPKDAVIQKLYHRQSVHHAAHPEDEIVPSEDLLERFKEEHAAVSCSHPALLTEPYCWMPIETLPDPKSLGSAFVLVATWKDEETFGVSPAIMGNSLTRRALGKPPRLVNPYTARPLSFTPTWWCYPTPPPPPK